jgi:hypothetical protein
MGTGGSSSSNSGVTDCLQILNLVIRGALSSGTTHQIVLLEVWLFTT